MSEEQFYLTLILLFENSVKYNHKEGFLSTTLEQKQSSILNSVNLAMLI